MTLPSPCGQNHNYDEVYNTKKQMAWYKQWCIPQMVNTPYFCTMLCNSDGECCKI